MSALEFVLRAEPPTRLDLSALVPDRLAGLSSKAIAALPVGPASFALKVGDVFRTRGTDAGNVRFEGGSDRFDCVGAGMTGGTLRCVGNVGGQAGRGMTGGSLRVDGDAGAHAGSGMAGGRIEISGDAGERLGGPLSGEMAGMRGGVVIVCGNAGAGAGDRMRRGLIAIDGAAGEFAGSRMIAGTLIISGQAGRAPGYLMRRGTIVLGQPPASISPSFVEGAAPDGVFVSLLERWLREEGMRRRPILGRSPIRYVGDNAVLGLGEIFLASSSRIA